MDNRADPFALKIIFMPSDLSALHPTLYNMTACQPCLQHLLSSVFRRYVDNHAATVMQIEVSPAFIMLT